MAQQRSKIRGAEEEFGAATWEAWFDAQDARAAKAGQPAPPRPVGEAPNAEPAVARLNYGRWLADCGCGSAVLLFRDVELGRWFWCPSCGNAAAGGKLRPVLWPAPAERAQIEQGAESVPAGLANWDPGVEAERAAMIARQQASCGRSKEGGR